MNSIKKAACRTFQTVLWLALPILPYRDPKTVNTVQEVPGLLARKKIQRVLVVTDGFLHISGMLEPLKKALAEKGIQYTVYDETVPNPTIWNVEMARERYLENHCQALIGFGGGSAIDCAKAVGARIARPRKPIPKMRGILHVGRPIPYLIAIPTTAGTGSETTLATVITDDKNGHKFPVNDFPLIPRAAVLDPEMTRSLPPHMTAATGMDALTHAIEAYIAEIRRMNAAMGIPTKLPGIRREDIPQLAAYAEKEANPLYPVPVLMDKEALEVFYYDVMEEAL